MRSPMTKMSDKEGPTLLITEVNAMFFPLFTTLQISKYLKPSYDNFSVYYF